MEIQKSRSDQGDSSLLVFDTHPIQYRSPVFRDLQATVPGFEVLFFDEAYDGNRWWFYEVNKNPRHAFGLPLRSGFDSQVLGTRELGLWGFFRAARARMRAKRPQAVLMFGYYLPEHWLLWLAAQIEKIPLLFIGETLKHPTTGLRSRLKHQLLPLFFSRINRVVAIGKKSAAFYEDFGVGGARLTHAKYCVDNAFFKLPEAEAAEARCKHRLELGIPPNALTLLFVGRLFDRKRPWDALELQKRVAALGVHTIMVGIGEKEHELAEAATSIPGMHFLGFRNQAAVRELYHAADVLFLPSEFETWGLVVNEAFAAGMTAVVSDRCGVADDLVVPGETGFVIPLGELSAAAAAVKKLVENPEELTRLKQAAQQKVLREYSVEQMATAIRQAAREAAAGK